MATKRSKLKSELLTYVDTNNIEHIVLNLKDQDIFLKSPVLDIRVFNPPSNGQDDDSQVFQSAIDFANNNNITLLISTDLYLFNDVNLPPNISVISLGKKILPQVKSETSETVATGNGTATEFDISLSDPPVKPNSLTFTYKIGGTTYSATDDGDGNISGTSLTGKIDYVNGTGHLTFSNPPDNSEDILCHYTPVYLFQVNGEFFAPKVQIFDGDGLVLLNGNKRKQSEWWGLPTFIVVPDKETEPEVYKGNLFKIVNTEATEITNFRGGVEGQEITLLFLTSNTTLVHGDNIKLKSGANVNVSADTVYKFIFSGDYWYEI